jgi:hypothetical protein
LSKASEQLDDRFTEADFLSLDAQLLIGKAATNFPYPPRAAEQTSDLTAQETCQKHTGIACFEVQTKLSLQVELIKHPTMKTHGDIASCVLNIGISPA